MAPNSSASSSAQPQHQRQYHRTRCNRDMVRTPSFSSTASGSLGRLEKYGGACGLCQWYVTIHRLRFRFLQSVKDCLIFVVFDGFLMASVTPNSKNRCRKVGCSGAGCSGGLYLDRCHIGVKALLREFFPQNLVTLERAHVLVDFLKFRRFSLVLGKHFHRCLKAGVEHIFREGFELGLGTYQAASACGLKASYLEPMSRAATMVAASTMALNSGVKAA